MKKTVFSIGFFLYAIPFTLCTVHPAHAQEDATSSVRDIVREKVKEKLDSLLTKKPMAAVGTLTQITDHSFEVKNTLDNKTQLVAAKNDTKYFQTAKGKKKEAKFEDLTLGESVLAMGFKNSSGVLEAQRIIGYDSAPLTLNKKTFFGRVTDTSKSGLTIQEPKTKQTQTIKVASNTKLSKATLDSKAENINLTDIQSGDVVVVIGKTNDKGIFEASTVRLVSSSKSAAKPSPTPKPQPKAGQPLAETPTPTKKPTPKPTPTPTLMP